MRKIYASLFAIGLMIIIGGSYAFFTYTKETQSESKVVVGDIYLNYTEGEAFELTDILPSESFESEYFEFTLDGKNTSEKDIVYEIMLNYGNNEAGKVRVPDDKVVFKLVEVNNSAETVILDNARYDDLSNGIRMHVDKVDGGTDSFTKTYRLYMRISEKLRVCGGEYDINCDFYQDRNPNFNNSYANIVVSVNGDFYDKIEDSPIRYAYLNNATGNNFWPTSINDAKSQVTRISFEKRTKAQMDDLISDGSITKENVTVDPVNGVPVIAYLEGDFNKTMYVVSEGIISLPEDSSYMLANFNNATQITLNNIDTSNVTNMQTMFEGCRKVTSLDLSKFDTSKVTDMSLIFDSCSALTTLDISSFDTSNVTNMECMFSGLVNLPSLDVSHFNTSKVTNMSTMFSSLQTLTSIDVSNFNTSNVTNMNYMFSDMYNLTSLNLANFDTSKVTDMSGMFTDNEDLVNLNLSSFVTNSVTTMQNMFKGCSSLANLNISHFNTGNLETSSSMFEDCSSLVNLNLSNFTGANLDYASSMFSGCTSLSTLDLSKFNTSLIEDEYSIRNMFSGCTALTTLKLGPDFNLQYGTYANMYGSLNKNTCTIYALNSNMHAYFVTNGWTAGTNLFNTL